MRFVISHLPRDCPRSVRVPILLHPPEGLEPVPRARDAVAIEHRPTPWPLIVMATVSGTPARTRSRIAVGRRSWKSRPGTSPARAHPERQARRKLPTGFAARWKTHGVKARFVQRASISRSSSPTRGTVRPEPFFESGSVMTPCSRSTWLHVRPLIAA